MRLYTTWNFLEKNPNFKEKDIIIDNHMIS